MEYDYDKLEKIIDTLYDMFLDSHLYDKSTIDPQLVADWFKELISKTQHHELSI